MQIFGLLYRCMAFQFIPIIHILNIIGFIKRNYIMTAWATNMKKVFQWNHFIHSESHPLAGSPCIYFANHRESIDFPIDILLTCGYAGFISRNFVGYVIPFMGLLTLMGNSVFYFDRTKIQIDKFVDWVYVKMQSSNYKSIIIYPEGTRRTDNFCINPKKGGIMLSYKYKYPIQIIITKNKELVCSVLKLNYNINVKLYTYMSSPIIPLDSQTLDEYVEIVTKEWHRCWEVVYADTAIANKCVPYILPDSYKYLPTDNALCWVVRGVFFAGIGLLICKNI